jgi:hypothetical protein
MRSQSHHYSWALQVGLALSFAGAAAIGAWSAVAHARADAVKLATQDLRARSAELVDIIDARRSQRATDTYVRAQLTQWDRAVASLDQELADAPTGDAGGPQARAFAQRLRAIGSAVRDAPARADDAAHAEAARITQALIAQERAARS